MADATRRDAAGAYRAGIWSRCRTTARRVQRVAVRELLVLCWTMGRPCSKVKTPVTSQQSVGCGDDRDTGHGIDSRDSVHVHAESLRCMRLNFRAAQFDTCASCNGQRHTLGLALAKGCDGKKRLLRTAATAKTHLIAPRYLRWLGQAVAGGRN